MSEIGKRCDDFAVNILEKFFFRNRKTLEPQKFVNPKHKSILLENHDLKP